MSRRRPSELCSDAGFTLIEALVALAVVAAVLSAISPLMGLNFSAPRKIDERLALAATLRSALAEVSASRSLPPGDLAGESQGYRWTAAIEPFESDALESAWTPQRIVIEARSPSGSTARIETVRLYGGPTP